MKVLLSWLREFAPIEGDPADLGEQLSGLGLAVESIKPIGEGLGGIVVARVLGKKSSADPIRTGATAFVRNIIGGLMR